MRIQKRQDFPWQVKLTECHPRKYKVYPESVYKETNDTCNFFENRELAQAEADRRNDEHNAI